MRKWFYLGVIVTMECLSVPFDARAENCLVFPIPEIHQAASTGDVAKVAALISSNPALLQTNVHRYGTPLHVAAGYGHTAVVEFLIAKGADVNVRSLPGDSPIDRAVINGQDEMVATLLRHGATERPLHTACHLGHTNIMSLLLEYRADPNSRDRSAWHFTPLHIAARQGHVNAARLLLARKVNVDVPDEYRATPLLRAVQQEQVGMVRLLLDNGARVNATNLFHDTPLHAAACKSNKAMVGILLDAGANINARNKDGFTPLKCATKFSPEIAAFLRAHGGKE